jgi:hypothetical protein
MVQSLDEDDALALAQRVDVHAPPGCAWREWEVTGGGEIVRLIRGHYEGEGLYSAGLAIVNLDDLSAAGSDEQRLQIIRAAQEKACRDVIAGSLDEARPGDLDGTMRDGGPSTSSG